MKKKINSMALKSSSSFEKVQALQAEKEELCSKDVEDDELSLLFRRINQIWKHGHKRLGSFNITCGHTESSSS
jgi:hypothetical protein